MIAAQRSDPSSEITVAAMSDQKPDPPLSITVIGEHIAIASPRHDSSILLGNPLIKECHVEAPNDPKVAENQEILPGISPIFLDMGSLSRTIYRVTFHVNGDPFDAPSVICTVPNKAFDRTFTSRSISFRYVKWLHQDSKNVQKGFEYFPVRVGVQSPTITDISVTGGDPVVADSPFRNLTGNYTSVALSEEKEIARFDWNDETKRDVRDLALIVIGCILGLTSTAIFELLKLPFRLDN